MGISVLVVRFGREAAVALSDEVASAQLDDPLAPVTVLVPRSSIGLATRRLLASGALGATAPGRSGVANVRFTTLARLADQLGGPQIARDGRLPATDAVVSAAVRSVLADTSTGVFRQVRTHPSTERAVAAVVRDLRGVAPAAMGRLASAGDRAAQVTAVAREVRVRLSGWYDGHDLVEAALEVMASEPRHVHELGRVVLYLPAALNAIQRRLVAAVAETAPVVAILGATGDAAADEPTRLLAEQLAAGSRPSFPQGGFPHGTEMLNAPSADAEVLMVLRDLVERHLGGVPLERMAVVHGGVEPYPRLLQEALAQAAIPTNGHGVRPLSATMVGRTLLGALGLADGGWRREDVMAWIAGAPIRSGGAPVPATAWDGISRRAGITSGLATWAGRLADHAGALVSRIAELETDSGDDDAGPRRRRAGQDLAATRSLAEFVEALGDRMSPADAPATWTAWARWAENFLGEYLGEHHDWRPDEEQALVEIRHALNDLASLDGLDPDPDVTTFRRALAAELDRAAPTTSRFGDGVLVGRVDAAVGLDLDVVYVVGMSEGVFPARPRDDPLLPDAERAAAGGEIPMRAGPAHEARRVYLAALGSAPVRILSLASGDQRRGRNQRPSVWFLESVSAAEGRGRTLYSRNLPALVGTPHYRSVPSLTAAIRSPGEPASLADRDLRSLLVWAEHFSRLDGHVLLDVDPVLRLGLTARRQRGARGFTRFDGLVAGVSVPSPAAGAPRSPTSLQNYGSCPRRYLLDKVLEISVPERPEDIQRISPADRGNLIHKVLENFIAAQVRLPRHERIRPGQSWPAESAATLEELTEEAFQDYERRGLTGRALLWEIDKVSIGSDLRAFLTADDRYRDEASATPEAVEAGFGPGHTDPVTIDLTGGRQLAFKGVVDRIDLTADGGAIVLDYKTGSRYSFNDISEQAPFSRGTKLQLPIYGLAARALLGDVAVRSQYWFVSTKGGFQAVGYDLSDEVVARLHSTLGVMVDGIEGGIFPGRPGSTDRDSFENCRYCDFDALCPSQRDLEWERVRDAPELAAYVSLSEGDEP